MSSQPIRPPFNPLEMLLAEACLALDEDGFFGDLFWDGSVPEHGPCPGPSQGSETLTSWWEARAVRYRRWLESREASARIQRERDRTQLIKSLTPYQRDLLGV
jgi:hypothetical protein